MLRRYVIPALFFSTPLILSFAAFASADTSPEKTTVTMDISTVLALISVATAALTAGRVVFVLEDRVRDMKERVTKLEGYAEEFNGPARAKHVELVGRVNSLEVSIAKLATTERVDHMMNEMRRGFDDVMKHLRRLERDHKQAEEE